MPRITLETDTIRECDVLVAGGGAAGCATAIAAARAGARVILMESEGCLGGMATLGLVGPISATHSRSGADFGGLMREILDELSKDVHACTDTTDFHATAPQILRFTLLRLVRAAGVAVHFHTRLLGAECATGMIRTVWALTQSGAAAYRAKQYVDATGDGHLIALAGEEIAMGSEPGVFEQLSETGLDRIHEGNGAYHAYHGQGAMQPVSIMFRMGGVDGARGASLVNRMLRYEDLGITKEAFRALPYAGTPGFEENGELIPLPQGRILFFPATRPGEYTINMSRVTQIDAADAESLNRGEALAQSQVLPLADFLRRFVPGFENAYLIDAAMTLGVRESRRLVGRKVFRGVEAIRCARFEDAIARGSYIIDIHDPYGKGLAIGGQIQGDYYEIPYGALLAKRNGNLLACGRCISADHVAHSSTRIIGTCMQTGQAAGTAAALAAKADCAADAVDIHALRARLALE